MYFSKKILSAALAATFLSSAALAASFNPGNYSASAVGMKGPVTVHVTFTADKIEKISVDPNNKETVGIGSVAIEKLPAQIISAQSTNIQGVSGASMTSRAILQAVSECIKQAGVDPSTLKAKKVDQHAVKETLSADIVIIGGGVAGMSAAVNAADHGAKVIIIEKMPFTGGASAICGGQYAIQGSKLQKQKGVENDPPQALVYDLIGNGHNYNNLSSLKTLAEQSPRAADWAIDRFKLHFIDQKLQYRAEFQFDRSLYLKNGCGPMAESLRQAVKADGIKVLTDTRANKLVVKNGRVIGVQAHGKNGTSYLIKGNAVLLATGGYGANKDMLVEPLKSALYYGPVSSTGDGHKMAEEIGVPLELMQFGKRYPNGVEAAPGRAASVIQGNYRAWLKSGILVNANGKRVVNEKASNNNIMRVLEKQPRGMLFLVMDESTFTAFKAGVHTLGITDEQISKWLKANGSTPPIFAHGKTLKEAAEHAKINAEELAKTIDQYNEYVKAGKDAEFGRPAAFMKETIKKEGPYYIVEQQPRFATTMGSVKVNEALEVLGKDGKPIPGLYAAGEIANAVHGDDSSPGMNISWGFTSGKVSSENMLKAIGKLK